MTNRAGVAISLVGATLGVLTVLVLSLPRPPLAWSVLLAVPAALFVWSLIDWWYVSAVPTSKSEVTTNGLDPIWGSSDAVHVVTTATAVEPAASTGPPEPAPTLPDDPGARYRDGEPSDVTSSPLRSRSAPSELALVRELQCPYCSSYDVTTESAPDRVMLTCNRCDVRSAIHRGRPMASVCVRMNPGRFWTTQ